MILIETRSANILLITIGAEHNCVSAYGKPLPLNSQSLQQQALIIDGCSPPQCMDLSVIFGVYLDPRVFKHAIKEQMFKPSIDVFASRAHYHVATGNTLIRVLLVPIRYGTIGKPRLCDTSTRLCVRVRAMVVIPEWPSATFLRPM